MVYGSSSKPLLVKVDPIHDQSLRLSLGAFRFSPVNFIHLFYAETHEPPLEILRIKLALQYIPNSLGPSDAYMRP